jgi:hypothetical protein
MNKIRYPMFTLTVFLIMSLSLMNVTPALADDGPPPVVESPSTETPPVSEDQGIPVAELPEGTEIVVLSEEGETLPLVSQEAAHVVAEADPQWCPVGVTPGSATCSGSFTYFNGTGGLIEWLVANSPSKAGVIWIEDVYTGTTGLEGGTVELDGLDYGNMHNYALTINGGWLGGTSKVLNPNYPSEFNVPFHVIAWNNSITINNLYITGASGAGANALHVVTTGNITLNNVDVQNNTTDFSGAELNNSIGTGNITVNDSSFNENNGSNAGGLSIISKGTVTLKNVIANGNLQYGVSIYNVDAAMPKAVNVNGANQFSYNGWSGLSISTKGAVTLNNITAIGNVSGSGAIVNNCDYDPFTGLCSFGVVSGVTLKGTNVFSHNGWDGLRVFSGGVITASNLTANGNGTDVTRPGTGYPSPDDYEAYGKGVFLHNYGALTAKAITLTGVNTFNGNASSGLFGYSFGAITVNNVTASGNGCDPLFDTNSGYCAGAYLEGFGITQTGYGIFQDNVTDGLTAVSYKGSITLNNLYVDDNDRDGVSMCACGSAPVNVIIKGVNVFTFNNEDGLDITSNGTVTLSNLTADWNGSDGVVIDNTFGSTSKSVTILGANTFNNNSSIGLKVISFGAITTNNLIANANSGISSVYLDNCNEVILGSCDTDSPQAITMKGINSFNGNSGTGLLAYSRGAITVSNLTTTFNNQGGAALDNAYNNAVGGITGTGYIIASDNFNTSYYGLLAKSAGNITLANVTASNNEGNGLEIDNDFNSSVPVNVTVTGTNVFNNNEGRGLDINSYGTVVLNNVTANQNDQDGAEINNSNSNAPKSVTLNGTNTFNENGDAGLVIDTSGFIKINNIMANLNLAEEGAYLYNQYDDFTQPITITGYGIFNGNGNDGLQVSSNGAITLANITANNNAIVGLYVSGAKLPSAPASAGVNVILTGSNVFHDNIDTGLYIVVDGMITLNNITANNNDGYGAQLFNIAGVNKTITLNGTNQFIGNLSGGLDFSASGNVMLTRVTAERNNDLGVGGPFSAGISGSSTSGSITLMCAGLFDNEGPGYNLGAGPGKTITLKGVFSFSNGFSDIVNTVPIVTRNCPLP